MNLRTRTLPIPIILILSFSTGPLALNAMESEKLSGPVFT